MNELDVFVSVGGTANKQQEDFVSAVEERLRSEGLTKQKMVERPKKPGLSKSPGEMTVMELLGALKPSQLWSVLIAVAALVTGAFVVGGKLFVGH